MSAVRINQEGIEDLLATYPLGGGEAISALDASTWVKNYAAATVLRATSEGGEVDAVSRASGAIRVSAASPSPHKPAKTVQAISGYPDGQNRDQLRAIWFSKSQPNRVFL